MLSSLQYKSEALQTLMKLASSFSSPGSRSGRRRLQRVPVQGRSGQHGFVEQRLEGDALAGLPPQDCFGVVAGKVS